VRTDRLNLQPILSPAAPAAVMAIGIFGLASLPRLGGSGALPAMLAIGLLGLWLFLAACAVRRRARNRAESRGSSSGEAFAFGTWVAGTVVTAKLLIAALPAWRALATGLELVALPLLARYAWIVARWLPPTARDPVAARVSGGVLLVTVAIQAVALALPDLLPLGWEPPARALIACGAGAYLVGAALVVRRYLRQGRWTLAEEWENANCILHGALSITGLAAVTSGELPAGPCLAVWCVAGGLFVLVEAVEATRLLARLRRHGWRRAVFVYDTSQWARNFTFGMFVAFTAAFAARFGLPPGWLGTAQAAVLAVGPWIVAGLLLVEAALFLLAPAERPS
jgi:hypothetical protein